MTARSSKRTAKAKHGGPGPAEVAPGVFVGGWKDAEAFTGARICVLDERPEELDEMKGAAHVPIFDGEKETPLVGNLDRVAELVHAGRERGSPVLVFCGHGVRRGPLGGAWYLHRYEGMSLDQAFDRIESVRPHVERPRAWMGAASELLAAAPSGRPARPKADA